MADKSDWDIDSWKTEDKHVDELAQLRAEVDRLRKGYQLSRFSSVGCPGCAGRT